MRIILFLLFSLIYMTTNPYSVANAQETPKVSCPVSGGKIITSSYDANPVAGHCGSAYGYPCQCGSAGRRAKAIDIDTSAGQDVVLPSIEGKQISWKFIETGCAGTGSYPACVNSNGGTGAILTFLGTDPADPNDKWYIQFVHMDIGSIKLSRGSSYPAGTVVGKTDSTAHVHTTIGRNLNVSGEVVTGPADCDPNWLASDFICDPSMQPPTTGTQPPPTGGTTGGGSLKSQIACTRVGNPTAPMPNVCMIQKPTTGGNPVPMPGTGTSSKAGNVFYCQGDPRWANRCSMAWAGCGPTSMAMVLSSYGDTITPAEMDELFNQRGFRACGDYPSEMTRAIQTYLPERGYTYKVLLSNPPGDTTPLDLNKAQEYLSKDYLIIGSVDIHIFVIDGVDLGSNTLHMRDPAACGSPEGVTVPNNAPWKNRGWFYAYAVKKGSG